MISYQSLLLSTIVLNDIAGKSSDHDVSIDIIMIM